MRPASPVRRNRKRRALRTTQPLTRLAVLPSCCTKKAGAMDSRKSYLTAQTGSGSELGRCGFAVQFYASLDTGTSISWSSKGRNVRPSRRSTEQRLVTTNYATIRSSIETSAAQKLATHAFRIRDLKSFHEKAG